MTSIRLSTAMLLLGAAVAGCKSGGQNGASQTAASIGVAPSASTAEAQLAQSPRHGEFVTIEAPISADSGRAPGGSASPAASSAAHGIDSIRAWVVYPERKDKAPVVVVIHEIYGLSTWIRSVADQLAAEGYIAIAPDLTSGKGIPDQSDANLQRVGPAVITALKSDEVQRRIIATAEYGMSLPAALPRYGVVGFCWGGSTVFNHAVTSEDVGAVVVYYGAAPSPTTAVNAKAPILGLFGENDARVNMTIPPMDSALAASGKRFEKEIYSGAGHGFLRQQDGAGGANRAAAEKAWPRTISFLRETLGR